MCADTRRPVDKLSNCELFVMKLNSCVSFKYIRGSVHRNSRLKKSNEMQQYADIYLLLNYSTCFRCPSRPSSGAHKTVVAASGTDYTIWGAKLPETPPSKGCTRGCNYSFMYSC